ncbi:YhdP family protein [Vibrio ziniensis]|uniref:TIGR02099 family protein n=1 Tax=Vibrio ziniensis TaxID=2711221 RepID=A0A6G7CL75_9VIBR|nr:YhdP family protein [Vibrio ziniensis]QIH42820.1 TIGR02099 family protein [Vibrio ziniensis]
MISTFTRLGRFILWLIVSLLILLAIAVTALRVMLPEMNRYQGEIQRWVTEQTNIQVKITDVRGFWKNTHPSLALKAVRLELPASSKIHMSTQQIDIEFDLLQSMLNRKPVIADMSIHGMKLDISSIDWRRLDSSGSSDQQNQSEGQVVQRLDDLFLRQLDNFSLLNSTILYQTIAGDLRQLDIAKLRWRNKGSHHFAEGEVSLVDTNINSLLVSADFEDHGSLRNISGDFYVSAENLRVTPWLTRYLKEETGINRGRISFNAWMTLNHNQPVDGYVELKPSELIWGEEGKSNELLLESGFAKLIPSGKGWQVNAHSLQVRTNDTAWPELDIALDWQPEGWKLNLSQLDIETLLPIVGLMPDSTKTTHFIDELKPGGLLEDIRISMGEGLDSLRYSAQLTDGKIAQWELLPEVHQLQASITGSPAIAKVHATLIDDTLPYGDVFQAPLNIRHGDVNLVWQTDSDGWSLWSDKVTVATPDLQALGAFRLDFPRDKSPFLSFYLEADAYNAGETWRYLPTRSLGEDLTDYLSTAIQGGRVDTAKLIWYGDLGSFPYHNHNGVFQAWVGLKDGKFSFDTAWPTINNLQLDLLFENEAMYLDSNAATLMDVTAKRITGRIPSLAPDGHIEIEASAVAEGNAVRAYMTATPLVSSVGAALNAIQVSGEVNSEFQLNIPFTRDKEPRAWGWADLANNHVDIDAPPMMLDSVSGRINFDNDVITAAGLSSKLLKQPISFDFRGESSPQGYAVNIDVIGDWDVKPLVPYVGERWLKRLKGHATWQTSVALQLNDVGFTYQIDSSADLKMLASEYPYPLAKKVTSPGKAHLQASGNQESITARLQLPRAKYQAEIDIRSHTPVLTATNLVLGQGSFKISPVVGHQAQVRLDRFNLDDWIALMQDEPAVSAGSSQKAQMSKLEIPTPQRVDLKTQELTLAGIEWHDVDFNARQKALGWIMKLDSQEAKGQANYIEPYDLSVSFDRLHVFIPSLDEENAKPLLSPSSNQSEPLISDFDREFHRLMPNLTLVIQDFWLQGYKVGKVNVDFQRRNNTLEWKNVDVVSGTNRVHMSGDWTLTDTTSHTTLKLDVQGENNSDLMERFGISSGIQQASFNMWSDMQWDGAPWSMKVNSLKGSVKTKLGKGIISDVSGAANLLGLFSLDSIIRKMQLDFSDVFDKGMTFNSITGSGEVENGVFVTNDIEMDAVAGELTLKGLADLNSRTVDAEVSFVPDMTSGIPVLTAFAVTPQTALYVLAITTVIAPVVEVFTEVNYEVKGPMDSPTVKELSRSRGEFKLPKKLRDLAK